MSIFFLNVEIYKDEKKVGYGFLSFLEKSGEVSLTVNSDEKLPEGQYDLVPVDLNKE